MEVKKLDWKIPLQLAGQRLDQGLATLDEVKTRSQANKLIKMGCVRQNAKVLKSSYIIQGGEDVELSLPLAPPSDLIPYHFPLDIIYEDNHVIVVNKPAGLVVHPAYGHAADTLVNALLSHTTQLSSGFEEGRPGLVHRIDKDTSGLLVIAKTDEAQRRLAIQFQNKTVLRRYFAIAYGKFKAESGKFESYLKRHPDDRKRMASTKSGTDEDGKHAITHYRVLSEKNGLSLVELKLETGRTHQIRVHLSEMGHPIVGDITYGADRRLKTLKSTALRKTIESMNRFALHAAELGFVHPDKGQQMQFSVDWPTDLKKLVEHTGFHIK